jgi:hypothetical protein
MIRVKISPKKITISGHADYEEYGKDIICSSVSSIVTTTVNAILMFDHKTIHYAVKEGLVKIDILKNDETTSKLLDNMINLLSELSNEYPKNIIVERE